MCLKAAAALGKLHLPSSPQVLFLLLHQTQSPSPEGWHQLMKNSASDPGTCLWLLFTYSSLIHNTPNELIPASGHTGSFLSSH